MSSRNCPPLLSLCLLLLGFCLCPAQQTENIFIVNIDGLRYEEGFASGSTNMPFVWDSLRQLGTLYENFYNTGITVTNAAHSTIVTGVRQVLENYPGRKTPLRPREPTLAEYFRRYTGAPRSAAAIVNGKSSIWAHPVSTWPGFGYDLAPTIVFTPHADIVTWESTKVVMDRDHPRLVYVLFGQVDAEGHPGDTSKYIAAIRRADSLTFLLWKRIQSDPVYRDRTTLILTNDHGRHDDRHGGWSHHGCACRGCRHVAFLALGPEIKADTAITRVRDQVDIAPTVGYLMGFPTPFAQGTVMTEMLKPVAEQRHLSNLPDSSNPSESAEVNLSRSLAHSRSADITRTASGLHVVYSDHSGPAWEVYYTKSTNSGLTWSVPVAVLPSAGLASQTEPVIVAVTDSIFLVASSSLTFVLNEATFAWIARGRRSTDSGQTWGNTSSIGTSSMITCKPSVAALGNKVSLVCTRDSTLENCTSSNFGATFSLPATIVSQSKHYPQRPAVVLIRATDSSPSCLAWQDCYTLSNSPAHDIWFDRSPWRPVKVNVTGNDTADYAYQPSLAADHEQNLHLVYCQMREQLSSNQWQVRYRRSKDRGATWTAARVLSTEVGYAPVLKVSDNGKVICIWASYEAPLWRILGCFSTDAGETWSKPEPLTSLREFSVEPRLAVAGDTVFIVWEDCRDGNWEIYFASKILTGAGVAEGSSAPHAILPAFCASPNPFNAAVSLRLTACGTARVGIYDASGRRVRSFLLSPSPFPIPHSLTWNGTDQSGSQLPAGVYSCVLAASGATTTQRLVLLK